jgi:large subunit ribosomal protein L35
MKLKLKTRKGVAKRFKFSKGGKIKYAHSGKSHLLSKKKTKRKRHLRKPALLKGKGDMKYLTRMLPYG